MIDRATLKALKKELKMHKRLFEHLFGDDAPATIVSAKVQIGVQSIPTAYGMLHTSPIYEDVTEASLSAKILNLSQRVEILKAQLRVFERAFGENDTDTDSDSESSS